MRSHAHAFSNALIISCFRNRMNSMPHYIPPSKRDCTLAFVLFREINNGIEFQTISKGALY